jgi:hypothetical protein
MKRLVWILAILILTPPAWAAKKITVQQLTDLLASLQQVKKSDADTAAELNQVELTEELTRNTMDSLASSIPGPISTQQLYILEARSAVLAPPPADLPSTPAPDAAAQKALLDKALGFAASTYAQLPHLTATKTTFRFQDNLKPPERADLSKVPDKVWTDARMDKGSPFISYIGANESKAESQNGAEIVSSVKDSTRWGANGQIISVGTGPVLSAILQDAQAAGKLNWLRWETVNSRQAAVFAFAVDKKKSHYSVNYCCFPNTDQTGETGNRGAQGGGIFSTSKGNMQINTSWSPYKETPPYHGEIFIDSGTGIIVRLVVLGDFKPSDVILQEDTRIDYGPVKVADKPMVLPVRAIINTNVVPTGQDSVRMFSTRRTLFTIEYKDYQSAGPAN